MDDQQTPGDAHSQQSGSAVTQTEGLVERQVTHEGPLTKLALSRRRFLVISATTAAAGASLFIGVHFVSSRDSGRKRSSHTFAPNIWVRIDPGSTVTITVAKSEMGQGVLTALAMVVAEELDADWSKVRVMQAPADTRYGNQVTDGSSSVSSTYPTLRAAGALARAYLVAAAAQTWGVDHTTCRTERGMVIHSASGRRLVYGDLTDTAARLPANATTLAAMKLKDVTRFTLIGTRAAKVDTPAKSDGSARFGLDIRLPGMHYAVVARCPFLGGSVKSFDASAANAVRDVLQVVQVPSGVAVVAQNTWAAMQGRRALRVTWDPGPNAQLDTTHLRAQLAIQVQTLWQAAGPAPAGANRTLEADYEAPFLAHAAMEPLNCTADVHGNRCEVWAPTQAPQDAQGAVAQAIGLPYEAVTVHVTFMGGGFGRRRYSDFVAESAQLSKAIGAPVQVVWTRDDDLQHDFYRPAAAHRLRATLDAQGLPLSWTHVVATLSNHGEPATDAADLPYSIPAANDTHISGAEIAAAVPTGIWRSFNYSHTIFAIESFIDEIAAVNGLDPYALRKRLLDGNTRFLGLIQLAAGKSGWGTALPPGWGRGMAICNFNSETAVAEVAEVSVGNDGSVRVQRVVCAVDCGLVINPAIAEAQIEGAVVYGLSAALNDEMSLAGGRFQQSNFHDYPLLRMNEMPSIEVYFMPSTDPPTGLGEPALPPIAPAVANAIYAATGKRVRRLPIRAADLH
jgi:isoquinoline 1-oxidoreductase beta subunit